MLLEIRAGNKTWYLGCLDSFLWKCYPRKRIHCTCHLVTLDIFHRVKNLRCYLCFLPVRILDGCYFLYNELSNKNNCIRYRYKKVGDSRPSIISLVRRTWRSISMHLRRLPNISGIKRNFFVLETMSQMFGWQYNTIQFNKMQSKATQCNTIQSNTIQCYNLYLTRSNVLQ